MSDLDFAEQAQLGLKYVEDAVVNLLTRHPAGLSGAAIGAALGLGDGVRATHRQRLVAAVLELLVASGRILEDRPAELYKDNPARG